MFLRPPRSTLFPYRRSSDLIEHQRNVPSAVVGRPVPVLRIRFRRDNPGDLRQPIVEDVIAEEDRKSTRLNSSHPSISYAVFCLKKKRRTSSARASNRPSPRR